jgi:hypothetical protein
MSWTLLASEVRNCQTNKLPLPCRRRLRDCVAYGGVFNEILLEKGLGCIQDVFTVQIRIFSMLKENAEERLNCL